MNGLTDEAEIDQKKQQQSQKAGKIDLICKQIYQKIVLRVRYTDGENNIVTIGPNKVSVSP